MNTPTWLLSFGSNVQSQHGEDGIIEKIFTIIGTESKWCVELGALTGKHGSNTWNVIKNKGWSGVLIEAEITYFKELSLEYAQQKRATCINAFVSFEGEDSLDSILSRTTIPKNFDLLSLDIDGNDYYVWESLITYRPRVMVVEFNPSIPNDVHFVQQKDMRIQQGSSLRAIVDLGKKKGYELVAVNETNAFFVDSKFFPVFNMKNDSLDEIHPDKQYITYFFQLYDGTIKISGNKNLIWHNIPIHEEKIQILPKRKQFFPNRIHPNHTVRVIKDYVRKIPLYSFIQRIRKFF
jgi:hypothetical protein